MTAIDYLIFGLGSAVILLLIVRFTWDWPELIYERKKEDAATWLWLRLLRIPETKANCVIFIRCNIVGVVVLIGAVNSYFYFTR